MKRRVLGGSFILIAAVWGSFLVIRKPPAKTADNSGAAPFISDPSEPPDPKEPEESPIAVRVVEARRGRLVIRLKSPGEAVTERSVVMRTEVAGVIKELKAREGLHVKAGGLLAALDDERFQLALERQEASRLRLLSETLLDKQFGQFTGGRDAAPEKTSKAKEDFSAAEADFREGLLAQAELALAAQDYEIALIESGMRKDEVMAASKGLTQAEIDVKTARLDLLKTSIRAPFTGIVTEVKVSPGENLEPGRELFTLVNISEIKVIARVLESEVGKIELGREVDLRFGAFQDETFKGRVEAVSPIINPEDRTCAVYVRVENPKEEIKPGMHAEVEIAAEVHRDTLLVPQDAVLVRGGRRLVFVVEDGLAKWRYIEVGLENESCAEVLTGVTEGEKVIVDGHFTLAHDARVSITN